MSSLVKLKRAISVMLSVVLTVVLITSCSTKTNKADNSICEQDQSNKNLDIKKQKNELDTQTDLNDIATLPQFDVEDDKVVSLLVSWVHPKVGDPDMDLWPAENRLLKKMYNIDVKYTKIPAGEIPTKHAAMVMAGDPADVVNLYAYADYPYSFTNGLYQPLDELLPLDSKVFDMVRKYIDTLRVNGEAYWAVNIVRSTPPCFIYNKNLIEEAGLEDPWELVKKNEWTWDTFFDYCKELTIDRDGDGTTDQYGAAAVGGFINNMVNTLGYSISKINENNQVEINLRDEGLMAYYEFLRKIGPFGEAVFHPLSFKSGDAQQKLSEEFLNENIAFYYGWDNGVAANSKFRPMLVEEKIGETILPKYPGADKQYIGVNLSGLGISKGAKHPKAAAAYITLRTAECFRSAVEIIEDSDRVIGVKEKELGVDLLSLYNGNFNLSKADIYDAKYINNVPVNTFDYIGLTKYINNHYFKDFPERVVFDFGQFATLTNYSAFEKIFCGDEKGDPVTAQQVIEEIQPQMQEKIDKFEKALNGQ